MIGITSELIVEKLENYFEYYLDAINGPYSYLLDTNRKLKKVLTKNPKEAMDQIGTTNPIYRFIRDNVKQYIAETYEGAVVAID